MLAFISILCLISAALGAPTFTANPPSVVTWKLGSMNTIHYEAVGTGNVMITLYVSYCGGPPEVVLTAQDEITVSPIAISQYACAQIIPIGQDDTGSLIGPVTDVHIQYDAGDTIDGACAAVCSFAAINQTHSGTVNFANFNTDRAGVPITIYTNGYDTTINTEAGVEYIVGDVTIIKDELDSPCTTGKTFMTAPNLKVTKFYATCPFNIQGGRIESSDTIRLSNSDLTLVNAQLIAAGGLILG